MRKWLFLPSALLVLISLFVLAGRPLAELVGLVRASADTSLDGILGQVPVEVRDKQLDHDLDRQRQSVIDREVQMNLSQRQVEKLAEDVAALAARVERRQRLLVDAYPVLQQATTDGLASVRFASVERSLADFQREVDGLLAEQEREERQLTIKRDSLDRLRRSVTDGDQALADMRHGLLALEQEIETLRARREQAQLEAETLDVVASTTAPGDRHTLGAATEVLRDEVEAIEVENEVRRGHVPSSRTATTGLARDWDRLERLKAIRDAATPTTPGPTTDGQQ